MCDTNFFIYRKINNGYYSTTTNNFKWWCTCKKGKKFGPIHNEKLVENLLMKIVPACDHLFPILIIYESKRLSPQLINNRLNTPNTSNMSNISNNFIYSKLLKNVGEDIKDLLIDADEKYLEIEKLFKSNLNKNRPFIDENNIIKIKIDDILNNIIYTKYVTECINNKWSCTCKSYHYKKSCKHIEIKLKREKINREIIETAILLANKFLENNVSTPIDSIPLPI